MNIHFGQEKVKGVRPVKESVYRTNRGEGNTIRYVCIVPKTIIHLLQRQRQF
jgi:hypothetical protein